MTTTNLSYIETTWGELADFYGVVMPDDDDRDIVISLTRDDDGWSVGGVHEYLGLTDDDWAFRCDSQAFDFIRYQAKAQEKEEGQ